MDSILNDQYHPITDRTQVYNWLHMQECGKTSGINRAQQGRSNQGDQLIIYVC
ncbi:hypothetical protein [Komagataeibacter kakiaceti]|uniref:hypothetical protein n=1 Tax=Komagataeibacter kakiaceti TaxID=943261 RepID=UPI00131F4447|nr:hypothetical protein [Komagataeibacter kakiaceti]